VENPRIIAIAFDGIDAHVTAQHLIEIHRSLFLGLSHKSFVDFIKSLSQRAFEIVSRSIPPNCSASMSMGYRNPDLLGPE
jgi:hypothetical protein